MSQDGNAASDPDANDNTANDLDLPAGMFRSDGAIEETTLRMHRRNFGLINVDVKFTAVNGKALFEGDIMLGDADEVRGITDPGPLGIGIKGLEFRWKDGIVPYVAQAALLPRVEAAITHWQTHTPIRFVKRTNEVDYISFEQLDGCWSRIGRRGGKQVISLGLRCSVGSAIHEIGHALGLWHEQSRADRDEHIEIIWENIIPAREHNFDQHILDGDDLGDYDYNSIMHYPATAFSVNDLPTIRVKGGQPIGQRNGLSKGDIAAIKLMYPDLDWPPEDGDAAPTG